jgi:hydrogenase maturation protein HypF
VLALGAHLKNTLTFTRDNKAFTSQYLGDMGSEHTVRYFKQVLAHYQHVFNFKPELVITDLHPDFYVRNFASELDLPQLQLQHHFAHLASVIANAESCGKKIANKVLGCILDGYGYGLDGSSWGGELIQFNSQDLRFELISQLTPLQVPGGDIAENEPWRIALALCVENNLAIPEYLLVHPQAMQVIELCKRQQFATSTSLGRKFSAVAALLNIVTESKYEAHAAMVMESIVHGLEVDFDYARLNLAGVPDFNLLIKRIHQIGIIEKNIQRAVNLFYGNLAVLIEKWILFHCSTRGISQVAISGGCWQSRYLLSTLSDKFKRLGIELLIPYQLPFNDECISFGQAWYGAQALQKGILCV